jgi:transcriptional regulator with XRE-family HTH domain
MRDEQTALSRRLRDLRYNAWPDLSVNQRQLAEAFGLSVPSISSWESKTTTAVPQPDRLAQYATFFATRRSLEGGGARLLADDELTAAERERRDGLRAELMGLRSIAIEPSDDETPSPADPWHFADAQPVTIVCASIPAEVGARMPNNDPDDPDHVSLYAYSDLDALFELYGHVRAANPQSPVSVRTDDRLDNDDYTTHLVLLGGVDFNRLVRKVLGYAWSPVNQVSDDQGIAGFEARTGDEVRRFEPTLLREDDKATLVEDVAHFFRTPNPFNRLRTLTVCNGVHGRGVFGAVRALTDARFRDRNAAYVRHRFGASAQFSLLSRVKIVGGRTVTPDWTDAGTRLHEWAEGQR